jgi:hypothetical protein
MKLRVQGLKVLESTASLVFVTVIILFHSPLLGTLGTTPKFSLLHAPVSTISNNPLENRKHSYHQIRPPKSMLYKQPKVESLTSNTKHKTYTPSNPPVPNHSLNSAVYPYHRTRVGIGAS